MSKFVIECPNCGKYAEAKTGFFARKKIDCACGYTINVRTDKLAGRECPHCGNMVVFDQSKVEKARCPVCHEPINTLAEQSNTVEFSCAQCGIRLRTNKAAATYTCPVCDCVNDVAERVATEKIKKDGLASIIKYEGAEDAIVWKHPIEDFNFGSQLIVHESQEAIFFRDGQALDLFSVRAAIRCKRNSCRCWRKFIKASNRHRGHVPFRGLLRQPRHPDGRQMGHGQQGASV